MKFLLYFLAFFFLGVIVQIIKEPQLDVIGFAFSVLGGLIISSVLMLNQTYKRNQKSK